MSVQWTRYNSFLRCQEPSTEAERTAKVVAAILQDEKLVVPLDASEFMGPKGRIFCYIDLKGECPSRDFLDQLRSSASKSYAVSFRLHCQGHQLRGEKHHVWQDCEQLGEYKHNQSKTRIMHTFELNNTHVLLFGFGSKTENDVDSEHVSRAVRLQKEYRQRRNEIDTRIRQELGRGGTYRGK